MENFTAKQRDIQETKFPIVKAAFKGMGDQIFIGVMLIDTGSASCILNKSILPYLADDAAIEGKTMKNTPYRAKAWSFKGTRCRSA